MSASAPFKAYKVTNILNGMAYIGITTQTVAKRWRFHVSWATCGRKGVLADAIREHGEAVFSVEHLASARSRADLLALEQVLVAQERTLIWDGGYNVTEGGEGRHGYLMPEHERQAIRDRLRGVPKSPEHRAKLAAAKRGLKASPEARANMSRAGKGKTHSAEHVARQSASLIGRPKSLEHRAKLSAAKTGQKASAETRAKLSAMRKGRLLNLSPEQRAKRSAAHLGVKRSAETRAKVSAARQAYEAARRSAQSW
jgi:group I intron endonuclease